jgi:hypothetical protein
MRRGRELDRDASGARVLKLRPPSWRVRLARRAYRSGNGTTVVPANSTFDTSTNAGSRSTSGPSTSFRPPRSILRVN